MGSFGGLCREIQFTRENQDQYALESLSRAINEKNGHLANEISTCNEDL